jgi:hypothetical protein
MKTIVSCPAASAGGLAEGSPFAGRRTVYFVLLEHA